MNLLRNDKTVLIVSLLLVILAVISGNSHLALAVSAVLAVLTLFNRESGILLLILFISLRPFLIEMNSGLKITGDLIIFSLLLWTLYNSRKNLKNLFKFELFEMALFLYLVVGVISALITGVGIVAIILQIRAYILFYLVYYVVKRMKFSKDFVLKAVLLTFITAVMMSVHGFVEKISDKTFLMPESWKNWDLSATNHIRVYGLLKGPNELALYLAIAFLISLYLLKQFEGWKKTVIYIGLSIIGATFLLTFSRGAFLALFVFAVFYLGIFRQIRNLVPLLITFAVSGVLFYGINLSADLYQEHVLYAQDNVDMVDQDRKNKSDQSGMNRYKEAFSETTIAKSSNDGRIYYVTKAIEVFKDHPIIGSGFGTFGGAATLAYSSPIYDDYDIRFNFYSDNQYILTLAETGIIGVLILTIVILSFLFTTSKIYKLQDKPLAITLLFFFTTMMVGGLVYNILENDTFMLFYFLALGLAYQKINQTKFNN